MNKLVDEQIKLYFGDDYSELLISVRKFVKATFDNHLRWGAGKDRLLDGEGGRHGMRQTAFMYIIEKGSEEKGLKAFSAYLTKEYLPSRHRHHVQLRTGDLAESHILNPLTLGEFSASVVENREGPLEASGGNASPPFLAALLTPRVSEMTNGEPTKLVLDQEEYDLATILGNNNSGLKEARIMLGWSRAHGDRVYQRLRRIGATGGNLMSQADASKNANHTRWHTSRGIVSVDCSICVNGDAA